jgi:hypothetical protein
LKNQAGGSNLLIYGDSQWKIERNLPQLLSEHFGNVISTRLRSPSIEMDEVANPDLVIFGCSERAITSLLTRPLTVPQIASIPKLPEQPAQVKESWIGNHGLYIDSCNEKNVGTSNNGSPIVIDLSSNSVTLYGWAADFNAGMPLNDLYLEIGKTVVKCEYGIERTGVSEHFNNENLVNTGFSVTFPTSYLEEGDVKELQFVQVSSDGTYRYEPVVYTLQYS